ncbi:MAG: hypothetical protein Ct9H300mP1_11470 [Planctomycetaceae bacterium]|nr:MAG: hypothetical protein Ct9H300mP1_11470 [Planctomycetaceae bacterium]
MTQNRRAEVDQALEGVVFETTDYQIEFQTTLGPITSISGPTLLPAIAATSSD